MNAEARAQVLYDRHPELRLIFMAVWKQADNDRSPRLKPLAEMFEDFGVLVIAAEVYGVPCLREATDLAMKSVRCDAETIISYADQLNSRY